MVEVNTRKKYDFFSLLLMSLLSSFICWCFVKAVMKHAQIFGFAMKTGQLFRHLKKKMLIGRRGVILFITGIILLAAV